MPAVLVWNRRSILANRAEISRFGCFLALPGREESRENANGSALFRCGFGRIKTQYLSHYNQMGRPKNSQRSIEVTITASPKLGAYLDDLCREEGYGNSRAEIARNLVWRAIEDLIGKRIARFRAWGPADFASWGPP
jgi:hypothetical protein